MDESDPNLGNKYIFKVTDCMGNTVVLKKLTYENKIHKDHPEVPVYIIKDVVLYAHLVNTDEIPYRFDYYRIVPNPIPNTADFIFAKVVVEMVDIGFGEVVTSHIMRCLDSEIDRGIIYDAGTKS